MTQKELIGLKALMGDPSDNIKGLKGIGKVTANDLIVKYKTIDNIYDHLDEIKKPSIVKSFEESKDDIDLLLKLVTIITDLDFNTSLDNLKISDIYNAKTYDVFKKYSLKSLYKKFDSSVKKTSSSDKNVSAATNTDDIFEGFSDIETKEHDDKNPKITYNLKNRYKSLDESGAFERFIPKKKIDDLSIMAYLIDPIRKDYNDIRHIEQDKCYKNFSKKINDLGLDYIYNDVELPRVEVLYNMEKIGIGVDEDSINKFAKKLSAAIKELDEKIHKLAGTDFNINSPKQLSDILFNKLSLDYEKKKGEKLSTSVEVLQKLVDKHKIIRPIMDYRTYNKLLTTYANALPQFIVDGRIHTNFNQTETATGRLSSDNPNLQNIPIRTELGRELRKVFVPRVGYTFIDADYSQIELRILAILSNDENLISAYNSAADVHSITASEVFGVSIDKVTPELRRKAKVINFGIVYGMSSYGLGEDLNIDTKEAKEYIDKYFAKYSKVKKYLDDTVENAKSSGFVKTYYGRIRPIPEFRTGNAMQKAFAKRVAMNSPIQGTAADIIKIAMIKVDERFKKDNLKSRLVLLVHDEIIIECKIGDVYRVKKIM